MKINILISAVILFFAWHFKLPLITVAENTNSISIISTLVQISAIMIGFVITAFSILISISDKPLVKNMNKTGHYSYLLRRLIGTALLFGMNLVAGLYMLFVQSVSQYIFIFLFATLVIALVILVDAARLFLILISNIEE